MGIGNVSIHPTAIIAEGAVIGRGTTVDAYSIVGPKVVLGNDNIIGPHVVIEGNTKIGNENHIFQFSSIGAIPQDLKYKGENSRLEIGDKNKIREFVTLQPGTEGGGMVTKIGSNNLFMANSHLGHDGIVGNNNVIANSAALAGHISIGSNVIVGGLCGLHQFVRIGDFAMIGAGAMVTNDIPPCCIAHGDRARLVGINVIGLERAGFETSDIKEIKTLYRDLFRSAGALREKLNSVSPQGKATRLFIEFLHQSSRGIASARKSGDGES